jgi:hypothetical protein
VRCAAKLPLVLAVALLDLARCWRL